MDLIYPSSTPALGGKRSTGKSYSIPLTLVALATTLSVVSIVLSVIVWEKSRSFVDEVHRVEGQVLRTTESSDICLPCDAILDASSSTEERMMSEFVFAGHRFDSSNTKDDNAVSSGYKDTCCAKDRRQLRWLLTMFLKIRSRKERSKGTRERRRCLVFPSVETSANGTRCIIDRREAADAAHLTGAQQGSGSGSNSSEGGDGFVGILNWTNHNVLHGHVVSSNGLLTIRGAGIYFVYSQIYFVEYQDDASNSNDPIGVYIKRFVNEMRQSEVLTERVERRCSRSTLTLASLCEYTVYAGSLVQLATEDMVYVTVSHPTLVNGDDKTTYFGLQKVT